jgi:hypothetical protein
MHGAGEVGESVAMRDAAFDRAAADRVVLRKPAPVRRGGTATALAPIAD